MSVVLTHEATIAREVRRSMSSDLVFFVQTYFKDEDGMRFKLKDFHVEGLRLCANEGEQRVIIEWPAAFGKSTHISKHYPIWLLCMNPNVQVLLGCQNQNHADARLAVIKAELEGNDALISDFGPFKSEGLWRESEINIAARTIISKDPTIATFGAGASIMGRRATHVVADDIVTPENSGANVEDQTRDRVKQQWNDGVKKVGYPGKPLVIRMINTVVDLRDLCHDLSAIAGHVPEEMTTTRWKSSKGYTVIRRPALDEANDVSLWPERRSVQSLAEEKAEDTLSFLRRMQNVCVDPENLSFRREWFYGRDGEGGSVDWQRCIHQLPSGETTPLWTLSAGYDPAYRMGDEAKWCAYAELAFDKKSGDGRRYYINDITRFRAPLYAEGDGLGQVEFLRSRVQAQDIACLNIEENAAQQWLLQVPEMKALRLSGYRIEGHNTNVKTKFDPETGVPAMAGIIRGGLLRFPYGCPDCRAKSDLAIGEFLAYPQGVTTDLVMAIWMARLAAEKVVRSLRGQLIERPISPYLLRHGMNATAAERFYPPRKLVN